MSDSKNAPVEVEVAPAKYADAALVRPEALAADLGLSGKVVRAYLRATFTRPIEAKGTTWVLTGPQANATYEHFVARRSPIVPDAS